MESKTSSGFTGSSFYHSADVALSSDFRPAFDKDKLIICVCMFIWQHFHVFIMRLVLGIKIRHNYGFPGKICTLKCAFLTCKTPYFSVRILESCPHTHTLVWCPNLRTTFVFPDVTDILFALLLFFLLSRNRITQFTRLKSR